MGRSFCAHGTEEFLSTESRPRSPSSKWRTMDRAFVPRCRADCLIPFSAPRRKERGWGCRYRRGLSTATAARWISRRRLGGERYFALCCRLMKNGKPSILLIEDDTAVREALQRLLGEAYVVETAATAEEGIARAQTSDCDVVVTDLQMPGISGLEVITTMHPVKPHLPVILMTAHHSTDTAIEAIKLGAYDYVLKPINPAEFLALIEKAVASRALISRPPASAESKPARDAIIGRSQAMQNVYKEIGRVAAKPVTVLIRGETGTGKELVARALYQHSDRGDQPFIVVNCVAIPETLLESELFGHEQGAFTGAQARRIGKFEQASKGTIFLDEIGDMSRATQAKLLRVLQEKVFQRVGGRETIRADVRIIAATHRDLEQGVAEKKFREDLYYRLNDAVIRLPSLRERPEDIPDLVKYFLRQQDGPAAAKSGITD